MIITFGQKFKALRLTHRLSGLQAAEILGFKSQGSVSAYEAEKSVPTLPALASISDLFCVSIDWLSGTVSSPYRQDMIECAEKKLLELSTPKNINLSHNADLIYFFYAMHFQFNPEYFTNLNRSYYCENYSLPQRANVIFALNFLKHASLRLEAAGFNSQQISLQEALFQLLDPSQKDDEYLKKFSNSFSSTRAGAAFAIIANDCLNLLKNTIIQGPSVQLSYDISTALKE